METNENLTEKLKYIGLDLENVPDKLNFFQNINFRMHKNYNEKNYKVYKYININDIEIFLTPTHRLIDYTEKYAKALPIGAYLSTNTDEEIQKNVEFLNLVRTVQIDDIEEIEQIQNRFEKNIPYNIQFDKDYLWQIHYDETTNKYYMLMPIKETECSALFYIIKNQIENKQRKIYVPICYANYSRKFWSDSEFEEVEKYLAFFTKGWPLIYEVHDKNDNMSIQIVGKTNIYDTIKSEYKIEISNQGDAEDFYKLLKALFILETQLVHHYKFDIKLDKKGQIHFYNGNKEIGYKELITFIKSEYVKGLEKTIKAKESKINLEKNLKSLKETSKKLEEEYYEKEKQISTFLECKKTFFGRVKYFFKYKKQTNQAENETIAEKEENSKLKYCERTDIKEAYTLEELLSLYVNLDQELASIKDLERDIEAINKRIEILKIKLENAKKYIKEIDEHKKSIFEFWRFTNKDEAQQLNAGISQEIKSKKLKKSFNYELDFEDVAKQFDKIQRETFSKEETDNIYIASTELLSDLNSVMNNQEVPEDKLENLKLKLENEGEITTFDIFGSMSDSREKIKTLGNVKHRENEKNMFAILNLKKDTPMLEYTYKLKNIADSVKLSMNKFQNTIEIPIYKAGKLEDGLNIFYINPENAVKNAPEKETNLYKIILKENTNCIPLTNIMYYNNANQTLPLGMNITDGILINTKELALNWQKKDQNYIIKINEEAKPEPLKVNIYENLD